MRYLRTAIAVLTVMILLAGCGRQKAEWNGRTEVMAQLLMVVDCSDLQEYTDSVSDVFVGTVTAVERNIIPDKPKQHEDNYSIYVIHVDSSLKGSLEGDVRCRKLGGYRKDGTMLLVEAETPDGKVIMDSGLPEEGKQYVFMAYEQPDGSLVLSEIFDNREADSEVIREYEGCFLPASDDPEGGKAVLKLRNMRYFSLSEELETEPGSTVPISLEYADVPEIRYQYYSDGCGAEIFADYVRNDLGIELDSRWKVFVHYYDEEQTFGMAEFLYTIGDIDTNKSIIFNLNDGVADTVYCKYLDMETDEGDLLRRVDEFKARYQQEKRSLREGEVFESETENFTYYYNNGKLLYSYNLFFSYGDGFINNDYGTECFIDENGYAVNG